MKQFFLFLGAVLLASSQLSAQITPDQLDKMVKSVQPKVVEWRRDFHQNPELGNREFKTQQKIQQLLQSWGISTRLVAKTGVVGVLKGALPGPVLALRADMDALPVEEKNNLPFQSKAKAEYLGNTVPVMHACGHDSHMAMLLGAAQVLSQLQSQLSGSVVFLFQPAEEGPPGDEEGGAPLMIKEGAMDNPKVDAVFGIHIKSEYDLGKIYYKPGAFMASSDWFTITVKGKQSHGAYPWDAVDPVMVSAEIINGLQTIVSRQMDLTKAPAVITVGKIQGGVRPNIIPETATMEGTIRSLDPNMQKEIHARMRRMVQQIAAAHGATAEIMIDTKTLVTMNDPQLVAQSLSALQKAAGKENVLPTNWTTGAEDFSFYGLKAPAFFFNLGARDPKLSLENATHHHTPSFDINDSKLDVGVRAFCQLVLDFPKK